MRIYNTLERKIKEFVPIRSKHVGMYTCGPTVYDLAHIGNFRTYTTADILLRVLQYNGYDVQYVMNITDVGHLTGDNLGDADTGEDRMEKSARKEGKSAWDIAKFYTDAFLKDFNRFNLLSPKHLTRATEHIKEQIDLVGRLEEKGFTYKTSDGIYFDTSKFPQYGKLSHLDQIKEGARVEPNPEKRNPRDFALWKFSPPGTPRQMEWFFDGPFKGELVSYDKRVNTPQGYYSTIGFPGWHIECSAMSMKYLGESFDIHVGGIDLSSTHHPNEIAQSEAATGKPFVKYWVHGAFILVDGKRMSKSLGNNYKLQDLIDKGFDPLALRYLYLQTHYRQEMNFTFEALSGAATALTKLYDEIADWDEPKIGCAEYEQHFLDAINDDLNMPKALSSLWDVVKSDYPTHAKAQSVYKMDAVLGLQLREAKKRKRKEQQAIPQTVRQMASERESLRKQGDYKAADKLRTKIAEQGYEVLDSEDGPTHIQKKR